VGRDAKPTGLLLQAALVEAAGLQKAVEREGFYTGTDDVERWELTEWLDHGLSFVGKPCRDLLFALYLDSKQPTYAEVAARLGMAVGSVGPTRIRCLKRLRQVLGE
jgi:DNA-directed RNA polymerase specialized sigma24 family protein